MGKVRGIFQKKAVIIGVIVILILITAFFFFKLPKVQPLEKASGNATLIGANITIPDKIDNQTLKKELWTGTYTQDPIATAAYPDSEQISTAGRTIVPEKGISPELIEYTEKNKDNEKIHVFILFSKYPNVEEYDKLKSLGLSEAQPFGQQLWVPTSAPNSPELFEKILNEVPSVKWLGVIKPEDKLDKSLLGTKTEPSIKVWISFYNDIDLERANKILAKYDLSPSKKYASGGGNISIDNLYKLAGEDEVSSIEQQEELIFPLNDVRNTIGSDNVINDFGYSGSGVQVFVYDNGKPDHDDIRASPLTLADSFLSGTTHHTAVAGTLGGRGIVNSKYKGIAPAVDIIFASALQINDDSAVDKVKSDYNAAINYNNDPLTQTFVGGIELGSNSWGFLPRNRDCTQHGNYKEIAKTFDEIISGSEGRKISIIFAADNTIKFRRQDIADALTARGENLDTHFEVNGTISYNGQEIFFEGSDDIAKVEN